jgi:drug/metabolite transporter (DMT)-like permease
MTMQQPTTLKIILAFAAIYIVWGSTFFAVHLALKSFPPFLLSTLRFLLAGIVLLIYCIAAREKLPSRIDIQKNALCGLVLFIGGVVSVVWAQQYISSSLASIIITTPFWFVLLDKKQWPYYFSNKWIIAGLITGLLGVIMLVGFKKGRTGSGDEYMQLLSILVMIGGSFLWVTGSLFLKYNPSKNSAYVNSSIQLLSAGIFCLLISWCRHEPQEIIIVTIRADAIAALCYLAIVSTLITFMAFVWLIKVRPPAIVSTYSYVNPLIAVLLGRAFAGESISFIQVIALLVILSGVLLVNIPKYRTKETVAR